MTDNIAVINFGKCNHPHPHIDRMEGEWKGQEWCEHDRKGG